MRNLIPLFPFLSAIMVCCLVPAMGQDITAPSVVGHAPMALPASSNSFSTLSIRFDEPIDLVTVGTGDVHVLSPQGIEIPVTSVVPTLGMTNQSFDVEFPAQVVRGNYQLRTSASIQDVAGNFAQEYQQMIPYAVSNGVSSGASPDLFVEDFEFWPVAPAYWRFSSGTDGVVVSTNLPFANGGVRHLALRASTTGVKDHVAEMVVDLSAQAGATDLFLEFYARDDRLTGGGQFYTEISDDGASWHLVDSRDLPEFYTKYLFDLDAAAATAGVTFDTGVHIRFRLRTVNAPNVYIDDVRIVQADLVGPRITEQNPLVVSASAASFSTIDVTFDEAIMPASFDATDVQIVAPNGLEISPVTVNVVAGSTNRSFALSFVAQTLRGAYRLSVGPEVVDTVGNQMNQDGSADNGVGYKEVVQFEIESQTPPGGTDDRYVEDVESWPPVPDTWGFVTSGTGTIEVIRNDGSHGGVSELRMIADPLAPGDQQVSWVLDLSAFTAEEHLFLEFFGRDESANNSGSFQVALSDAGESGFTLLNTDLPQENTRYLLDLDQAANTSMIPLDGETHLIFKQVGALVPPIRLDDIRVITADLLGPQVIEHTPAAIAGATVGFTNMTVRFNEAIDPVSFDASDVTLKDPQGFEVSGLGVDVVPGTTNRVFSISVPEQRLRGNYRLAVGPAISDLAGNEMNQNNDIINGDGFSTRFNFAPEVWTPADPEPVLYLEDLEDWTLGVPTYWSFVTEGNGTISATTNNAPAAGQFHLHMQPESGPLADQIAQVALDLSSQAGESDVFFQFVARDDSPSSGGQFLVDISGDGVGWTTVINADLGEVSQPYLVDLDVEALAAGILLDSDVYLRFRMKTTTAPNVFIDNVRVVTGDLFGPQVIAADPLEISSGAASWSSVELTFDESINAATLDGNDVSLIDPQGLPVVPVSIAPVAGTTNTVFDLMFDAQTTRGVYRLQVGPAIEDVAGNTMNQDQNALNGEAADFFAVDIVFSPTIWSPAASTNVLYLEDFESWPSLPTYWSFSSKGAGSILSTVDDGPFAGGRHLELFPNSPRLDRQWASVVVDLASVAAQDDVFLDFHARDDRPGGQGQFLVDMSTDGTNWVTLLTSDLPSEYTRFFVDLDAAGVPLDGDIHVRFIQEAFSTPRLFLDNVRFVTGDLTGAKVAGQTPMVVPSGGGPLTQISVDFDEAMDAASFGVDDVTLFDPQGFVIVATGVSPSVGSSATFTIDFPPQDLRGTYRISVGPDVLDLFGQCDESKWGYAKRRWVSWSCRGTFGYMATTWGVT